MGTTSRDNSNKKVNSDSQQRKKENEPPESNKVITNPFNVLPDRDSIGLFCVIPNNDSQLVLNQDPLASIYTGGPDSGTKQKTPMLGK